MKLAKQRQVAHQEFKMAVNTAAADPNTQKVVQEIVDQAKEVLKDPEQVKKVEDAARAAVAHAGKICDDPDVQARAFPATA